MDDELVRTFETAAFTRSRSPRYITNVCSYCNKSWKLMSPAVTILQVAPVYVPCSSAVWLPAWTLRDGASGGKVEEATGTRAPGLIRIRIDLPKGSRREVQWLDLSQLTNLNDFGGALPTREPNYGNKKLGVRIHDLGRLKIAHEAAILDVLRNRWHARQYCVMVGPALLLMRPPCTSYLSLPPHIWWVPDNHRHPFYYSCL